MINLDLNHEILFVLLEYIIDAESGDELIIFLLQLTINVELKKLYEEIDADLILECIDFILELNG